MYVLGPSGDTGHALTFGRTRGGKGVSAIVPALLTYKGSMVVIDPKGENAWITADRRRQIGQRVVIIDPWGEVNARYGSKVGISEHVTRFNPLSALDPASPDFADDVAAIAEAFILQTGNDPHWPDSARELVGGLIAAEVQRNPGTASMADVRKLIRAPIQVLREAIDLVIKESPDSVAGGKLAAFAEKDAEGKPTTSREIGSIRSTARTQTGFLDSTRLLDAMETDDPPFDLEDIAVSGVTLYLVLPVDRLKTHGRWLRMILTLAIRAISKQPTPPILPVLLLLDELGTISPGSGLSMVEQSFGLMAGLGIRIWGFLQDLPQLKRDYPESWETFISNSSVIQLLNVGDETTATYFSHYLGNSTIEVDKGFSQHTRPTKYTGGTLEAMTNGINRVGAMTGTGSSAQNVGSQQTWEADKEFHGRPVLFPWEVRASSPDKAILVYPGFGNMRLKRFKYYSDPVMSKWARHDPNKPAPSIEAAPPPFGPPPPIKTNQEILAEKATAAAGAAASAVGGFLKRKLDEKMGGKS